MHGYDLYRQISEMEAIPRIWNLKQSMLYALLDKLEERDYLNCTVIPGETRPSRKQYYLTDAGREAFEAWRSSPVRHGRDMRQDFIARLYFAGRENEEGARSLIDQQQKCCEDWLTDFQKQTEALPADARYDRLIIAFRYHQVKGMLDWLEICRQTLGN